jgi:hypothetical protein
MAQDAALKMVQNPENFLVAHHMVSAHDGEPRGRFFKKF